MLRSFRMANHLSFREEQELVLLPAYGQSSPVVPVAAVFGANASGKTNVLAALGWMQTAVLGSFRLWEAESGVPRRPYRLDPDATAAPTSFAVDLTLDGIQYTYGFSVDDQAVVDEWLHDYPHNRKRVIFEREGRRIELGSTLSERRSRADLLGSLLRDNALLLSTAVQANQDEVLPVYRWFRDALRFGSAQRGRPSQDVVDLIAARLDRSPEFVELIKAADLGITSVTAYDKQVDDIWVRLPGRPQIELKWFGDRGAEPAPAGKSPLQPRMRKELSFLHGPDDVPFGWAEQSEGTIAWMNLLAGALTALEYGALFVVDEVDASLHPRLTARLIELFRNTSINARHAQLLFTTHDATLLGTSLGEEVLRRDEIWFVEKRAGASTLYPLSDFHPRKEENRERRYLAGSYGAVPAIFTDSLVESVLATRTEPVDGSA